MTKDELLLEVLARRNRNRTYHSKVVSEALGTKESTRIKKIRSLKCDDQFLQENYIGRAYNDESNTYRVYYDIKTPGVLLLLLKQQDDTARLAIIEKLISYL